MIVSSQPDRDLLAEYRHLAGGSRSQIARSRSAASSARALIARTHSRLQTQSVGVDAASLSSTAAPYWESKREQIAADRLLAFEAADLAEIVPGTMETPRRRFAVALYEVITLARSLDMSDERLRFHLTYGLDRISQSGSAETAD